MALTLMLVRHAPTPPNREGRYVGHLDPPLDPDGEAAARALGRRLGLSDTDGPLRLVSSDLARARRTAALALPGVDLRTDRRLRELDFGAFDGLTYREALRRHGFRFRRWIDDPVRHPPPGGESLAALRDRVLGWLEELPTTGSVVAVAHGGPLRLLAARLLGLPFDVTRRWAVPPTSIFRTILEGGPP